MLKNWGNGKRPDYPFLFNFRVIWGEIGLKEACFYVYLLLLPIYPFLIVVVE